MATSFAASTFPHERLWVELAIIVAGELNPDIRGPFRTSPPRSDFARARSRRGAVLRSEVSFDLIQPERDRSAGQMDS